MLLWFGLRRLNHQIFTLLSSLCNSNWICATSISGKWLKIVVNIECGYFMSKLSHTRMAIQRWSYSTSHHKCTVNCFLCLMFLLYLSMMKSYRLLSQSMWFESGFRNSLTILPRYHKLSVVSCTNEASRTQCRDRDEFICHVLHWKIHNAHKFYDKNANYAHSLASYWSETILLTKSIHKFSKTPIGWIVLILDFGYLERELSVVVVDFHIGVVFAVVFIIFLMVGSSKTIN